MQTVFTAKARAGEFILSEAPGFMSRENAVIKSGQNLGAGRVLGATCTGQATTAAIAGNTGDGTIGDVVVAGEAFEGDSIVTFVSATKFFVSRPDGTIAGHGTVGAAFSGAGLAFTIAAGGTAFAAGDQFRITVGPLATKYSAVAPAATDGTQHASAVLYDMVDATAADEEGVVFVRECEVNSSSLDWGALTDNQIATAKRQLASHGIFVREAL